jgi:hypothetical protein
LHLASVYGGISPFSVSFPRWLKRGFRSLVD